VAKTELIRVTISHLPGELMRRINKITADDIRKALKENLDEWEDYIREVDKRDLRSRRWLDLP